MTALEAESDRQPLEVLTAIEAARNGDEPPELVPANLAVGSRLAAAATVFVFLGPAFAYFYLRSLNNGGLWRPASVQPPQSWGAIVVALLVGSASALALAVRASRWRALAAVSLALGIAAVVAQCLEYTQLAFGPMSGGYASVFVGWTALTTVCVLATMLWLETLLAYGLRHGDAPAGVVRPRLQALTFYWTFLAGLGAVMWVVLYLV
jgi:heme/copper-type cytochrome/quinol oxidase subunit 3